MMRILDRYLLRQFLKTFTICFCSLTGLFIVIDSFANLDEFQAISNRSESLILIMARHYGYQSIMFFDRTSGILTLIAAMFTVAWFQRHHEMTAILAAGISKARAIRVVIISVITISLAAAASREMLIPAIRDKIGVRPKDYKGGKAVRSRRDALTGIYLDGEKAFLKNQQIHNPEFRLRPPLDDYGTRLTAEAAFYQQPQGDQPGGYLFKQVTRPKNLHEKPSLWLEGKRIIITPYDASWLEQDECFVVSDVSFEQLLEGNNWLQHASFLELVKSLGLPGLGPRADVRVAIHSRIVRPLLDIALLFLGLPLVLRRENRSVFLAIGLCGLVVFVFVLVVLVFQQAGKNYRIAPELAAWAPLFLFVPVAVGISDPLKE